MSRRFTPLFSTSGGFSATTEGGHPLYLCSDRGSPWVHAAASSGSPLDSLFSSLHSVPIRVEGTSDLSAACLYLQLRRVTLGFFLPSPNPCLSYLLQPPPCPLSPALRPRLMEPTSRSKECPGPSSSPSLSTLAGSSWLLPFGRAPPDT